MSGEVGFGYPHPSPTVARIGGSVLCAGGAIPLVLTFADPAYSRGHDTSVIVTCLSALAVGGLFLAVPGRIPSAVLFALPAFSTVTICVQMFVAGTPSDGGELMLIWVVLFSGYFLSRLAAWLNLAFCLLMYVPVAYLSDGSAGLAPSVHLAGTGVVTLLIVLSLRARLADLLVASRREARTDALTGLLNRRAFDELSAHEATRCQRAGLPLAMLVIDIDHFKVLNDSHGHPAGDETLQQLADLLRTQTRGSDVLARHGGDEFAILLPACGVEDALRRAEHVRSLIERTSASWSRPLTASVGVAVMPAHARALPELVTAADAALYASKHAGRNLVAAASEPSEPSGSSARAA